MEKLQKSRLCLDLVLPALLCEGHLLPFPRLSSASETEVLEVLVMGRIFLGGLKGKQRGSPTQRHTRREARNPSHLLRDNLEGHPLGPIWGPNPDCVTPQVGCESYPTLLVDIGKFTSTTCKVVPYSIIVVFTRAVKRLQLPFEEVAGKFTEPPGFVGN